MRDPVHHPYPLAPESRIRRTSLHSFCNLVLGLAMVFPIQGVAYDQEYYVNPRNDAPDFGVRSFSLVLPEELMDTTAVEHAEVTVESAAHLFDQADDQIQRFDLV